MFFCSSIIFRTSNIFYMSTHQSCYALAALINKIMSIANDMYQLVFLILILVPLQFSILMLRTFFNAWIFYCIHCYVYQLFLYFMLCMNTINDFDVIGFLARKYNIFIMIKKSIQKCTRLIIIT